MHDGLPAIPPFHRLLRLLKANGILLGVDSYQRVAEYWQLAADDEALTNDVIKAQLCALLCRSEEQQAKFEQLFEQFLPKNLQPVDVDFRAETPQQQGPTAPLRQPKETSNGGQAGRETLPPPAPPSADKIGPVLPRLNFPEDPLRVWNLADMGPAMVPLQEKIWTETTEWDLPRTIQASIRSGGFPSLVYRKRKQAPRYLALIEQQSPRDHLAGYAAELVHEINRRDLEAEFYFFDKNPAHCWKEEREPATYVNLELLKSEWNGARLLLLSPAERFVNPDTGAPSNLALDLPDAFANVALLATNPNLEWGAAERSLSTLMPVLPMSVDGLAKLMRAWNGEAMPSLEDWQLASPEKKPPQFTGEFRRLSVEDSLIEAYRYLGDEAFKWLCACAVYPELYFELTCILHDEAIPLAADLSAWQQNERWNKALRLLSRLEWFRRGDLPEALEEELKKNLSPHDLQLVEGEIRRILAISKNQVRDDSYAAELRQSMYAWMAERSFRVLWVDDHPENVQRYIESWSKTLGIVFKQVTSVSEVYEILANERFDFIISDIGRKDESQPGQTTLDVVAGRAPVVFFTNQRGLNLRNTLLKGGALEVTNSIGVLRELLTDQLKKKFRVVEEAAPALDFSGFASENVVTQKKKATKKTPKPDGRVRRDQEMLKQLGYYEGEVDGFASEALKDAVRAFQSSNGLIADGIAGPQTRAAMERAVAEQSQQQSQQQPYSQSYAAPNAAPDMAPDFDDNSTYVYIEYSSINEEQAQQIASYLEDNDIEAIIDIKYMRSGEEIRAFIQRSMDVCEAAIFVVSSAALQSPILVKSLDYLFGSEFSRKKFFCCALDMEFRNTAYLSKAMLEIENKIKSLEGSGYAQSQAAYGSYGDNTEELKSYMEMRELLPKIINQLNHVQLIDISGNKFERGMQEIVNFLRPPTTSKRPVFK